MYFDVANIVVPVWSLLAWGGLVGLVFSTVGAAGGILASVEMISVFGIENPNLVKPMAQALTLVTPLILVVIGLRYAGVFSGRTVENASQHTLPFLPTISYSNSATSRGFQYRLLQRQRPPVDHE